MAEGNKTYKGLALPLNGEYEQKQITAATDMVSLTGASGQTGDFIVAQNSSGTEKFVVDANGYVTSTRVRMGSAITTAPTTGLVKGDLFVIFGGSTATAPNIGVCVSTATQLIKYFGATTETLGRQT